MIINITDIPPEGRDLKFNLDLASLTHRVREFEDGPGYKFSCAPEVALHLDLEGKTVVISGDIRGEMETNCSRCLEAVTKAAAVQVRTVMKPRKAAAKPGKEAVIGADDEDLELSYYDGKEIDCGTLAEELLVLSLPYRVICKDACKGLCPKCGANLNAGACGCPKDDGGDERMSVFRNLKRDLA